jgi:hypothetical protein
MMQGVMGVLRMMLLLRSLGDITVHMDILLFQRPVHGCLPGHIPRTFAVQPAVLDHALDIVQTLSNIRHVFHHDRDLALIR